MIRQSASSAGSATPLRLGARAEAVTVMSEAKRQKSDDPPYDGGDGDGDDDGDDGDDGDDDDEDKGENGEEDPPPVHYWCRYQQSHRARHHKQVRSELFLHLDLPWRHDPSL